MCVKWKKHLLRLTSFLLSLFLVCSLFILNSQPVKAIAGIDDLLYWLAFTATGTAGTFAGTGAEAALTGQLAQKRFGVHFPSQGQLQSFVQDFFEWSLTDGIFKVLPGGALADAAGHVVFVVGYKFGAKASVAAYPSLVNALAQFIAGSKNGTITNVDHNVLNYSFVQPADLNWSAFTSNVFDLSAHLNMSYKFIITNAQPAITHGTSARLYVMAYFIDADGNALPGASVNLGAVNVDTSGNVSVGYGNLFTGDISQATAIVVGSSSFSLFQYGSATPTYTHSISGCKVVVQSAWGSAASLTGTSAYSVGYAPTGAAQYDFSDVTTTGTGSSVSSLPQTGTAAGALDAGTPIGLSTDVADNAIPVGDVISGNPAATSEGTLENVPTATADAAASGDVTPIDDWTQPKDGIDWSPLLNIDLSKKFPFSLPWDFYTLASSINVTAVAPKWTIPLHFGFLDTSYTIDMSQYEWFVSKMRIFEYLVFLGIWIFGLYKIIKH